MVFARVVSLLFLCCCCVENRETAEKLKKFLEKNKKKLPQTAQQNSNFLQHCDDGAIIKGGERQNVNLYGGGGI